LRAKGHASEGNDAEGKRRGEGPNHEGSVSQVRRSERAASVDSGGESEDLKGKSSVLPRKRWQFWEQSSSKENQRGLSSLGTVGSME